MKMNWGKGIIIVFVIFFAGMAFMAYKSMTKNIDLVAQNYYEKEIKYQNQIDKINSTSSLKEKLMIETTGGSLVITYPETTGLKGDISFYRPSDAKKDFKLPVEAGKDNKQIINTQTLLKGLWRVQVNWSADGLDYYNEEKIMIQ
jgi:nitrogen fixation protein FixH